MSGLMSIKEAAAKNSMSPSQLRRLMKAGLPHYRTGPRGNIYLLQSEILAWFHENCRCVNRARSDAREFMREMLGGGDAG